MATTQPVLKKLSVFGILFTFIVGSILHFAYPLTDYNMFLGYFVPVSESVWEHLKLAFIAWLIYGLTCWSLLYQQVHNYWLGTFLASFSGNLFIVFFFYTYTSLCGHSILLLDLLSFLLACIIGAYVFYRILSYREIDPGHLIGSLLILLTLLSFAYFSYNPGSLPIFSDPALPPSTQQSHLTSC